MSNRTKRVEQELEAIGFRIDHEAKVRFDTTAWVHANDPSVVVKTFSNMKDNTATSVLKLARKTAGLGTSGSLKPATIKDRVSGHRQRAKTARQREDEARRIRAEAKERELAPRDALIAQRRARAAERAENAAEIAELEEAVANLRETLSLTTDRERRRRVAARIESLRDQIAGLGGNPSVSQASPVALAHPLVARVKELATTGDVNAVVDALEGTGWSVGKRLRYARSLINAA